MRKLIVSEFISLDGDVQAPGGKDEDRDGGFTYGGWSRSYWHDDIGATFGRFMAEIDTLLLGRRTYVTHAEAFEPDEASDPFGPVAKYVVLMTLEKSLWRNTTIVRDHVVELIRALKAMPGKGILTDGSSQLVPLLLAAGLV